MLLLTIIIFYLFWTSVVVAVGTEHVYDDYENDGYGQHVIGDESQERRTRVDNRELEKLWGGYIPFTGITSYAHLPIAQCLTRPNTKFDIAVIGAPFDTATTYRPGSRFGPRAIRQASSRFSTSGGFNHRAHINPFLSWASIIDCGDIPLTPMCNPMALSQMTRAFKQLSHCKPSSPAHHVHPKLITLGGDHSITLPALRALKEIHGPLTVLHFDSHLDTWDSSRFRTNFTHGSMLWMAYHEGLLAPKSSMHVGLRTRLTGRTFQDYERDSSMGWARIEVDEIDDIGVKGIVQKIMQRIGREKKVYLTVDIDVLDPGVAPGTGTPEPGGWTMRELIAILRGIEDLNVVGADVVEVAPQYDGPGEQTALAAAQVVYEVLTGIVKRGLENNERREGGLGESRKGD